MTRIAYAFDGITSGYYKFKSMTGGIKEHRMWIAVGALTEFPRTFEMNYPDGIEFMPEHATPDQKRRQDATAKKWREIPAR